MEPLRISKIDEQREPDWIDIVNRLQSIAITIAVFVLLIPCLYRIEKATTNTATQVEQLNSKYDALDDKIQRAIERLELWQKTKKTLPP